MRAQGREEGEFEKRGGRAVGDVAQIVEGGAEQAFLAADERMEKEASHGGWE